MVLYQTKRYEIFIRDILREFFYMFITIILITTLFVKDESHPILTVSDVEIKHPPQIVVGNSFHKIVEINELETLQECCIV